MFSNKTIVVSQGKQLVPSEDKPTDVTNLQLVMLHFCFSSGTHVPVHVLSLSVAEDDQSVVSVVRSMTV